MIFFAVSELKKSVCVFIPFELAILAIFLAGSIPITVLLFFTYSKKKPSLLAISHIKLFFNFTYFFNL